MADDPRERYAGVILAAFDIQRGDERRLDKRITDAVLETRDAEISDLIAERERIAAATLEAREAEVSELATELEHAQRSASMAKTRYREAMHQASQLQAHIDRVDALHQPTTGTVIYPCRAHSGRHPSPREVIFACPDCEIRSESQCSNITCCGWPCRDHLALYDETPESCTHG